MKKKILIDEFVYAKLKKKELKPNEVIIFIKTDFQDGSEFTISDQYEEKQY